MSMRAYTAVFAALLPIACGVARPAEPPAKNDAGWKDLFDGKSLDGWKAADYYGAGKVHVEDGALVLDRGKIMTGAVYTRGDLPKMDYEFTLEGKKIEGDDFFCTTTFPVGDSFCSLVVGGWGGRVVGLSSLDGADASMNETNTTKEFKAGQWYKVRVRVSKNRIEAWIDGDKLADVDTTDRKIAVRIECNACRPFGVATYETAGAVRNVRLRALTEADLKEIAETKPAKKD